MTRSAGVELVLKELVKMGDIHTVETKTLTDVEREIAVVQKLLEWRFAKLELERIEDEIRRDVLLLKETQKAGPITATYSGGRTSYDYEGAVLRGPVTVTDDQIAAHTTEIPASVKVDYRAICRELELDVPITGQTDPSVRIHIKEPKK
jgi:hypothetical protein